MKDCPICHNSDHVETFRPLKNTLKGIGLEISAVAVYLTTPIGKGASVNEAKRLDRKAGSELSAVKYRCTKCGTEFFDRNHG